MKIWIDFINTPQVSFSYPFINYLKNKGFTFCLTARNSSNTIELLKLNKLDYKIIGNKVHSNIIIKLIYFPIRLYKLFRYISHVKPDIAFCQSSFYLPIISKILGIPSIYTNDNEHALGNIPSFIFADKILIPEFLNREKVYKQFGKKSKIIVYPGIKEGVYLWRLLKNINEMKKKNYSDKKTIFFRPEPRTAQYYKGKLNFIDPIILELKQKYDITVSPRDNEQKKHYKNDKFYGIKVLDKPLNIVDIMKSYDIFIGAGGTMTREMAVAGIPTVSVYQGKLLDVDKYLIKNGYLIHKPDLNASFIENFIENNLTLKLRTELLEKGRKAEIVIKNLIINFAGGKYD